MFGLAFYIGACLVVAALITLAHSMMRPIHSKGDAKSWKVLLVVLIVCITGPYGYVETLTRIVGGDMKDAVEEGFTESGIYGKLQYYRVVSFAGDTARVIAVAEEKQEWGGA